MLVAFAISLLTAPAGVSGAFLLLPFQVSVLGFTGPAVSPTNLIYNVAATPGGILGYVRERRVVWPLMWTIVFGTLPGVFVGAVLRIRYLSDPRVFEAFVGLVLLYLGARLLYETVGTFARARASNGAVRQRAAANTGPPSLPAEGAIRISRVSMRKVEYEFRGKTFSFGTVTVFLLSLVVGVVGGIYGVGGGAFIAPFLVSFLGLPVYTVAGATLMGTFVTSAAGVAFFRVLAETDLVTRTPVSPDWYLGLLLGIGGLAGSYTGARLQRFLPEIWIKAVLGILITLLALGYLW